MSVTLVWLSVVEVFIPTLRGRGEDKCRTTTREPRDEYRNRMKEGRDGNDTRCDEVALGDVSIPTLRGRGRGRGPGRLTHIPTLSTLVMILLNTTNYSSTEGNEI